MCWTANDSIPNDSMTDSEPRQVDRPFAVWLTGRPASGKSTIADALHTRLRACGATVATLESDRLRPVLTPDPQYTPDERDRFYHGLLELGRVLIEQRVSVVFDDTANRAAYRERARQQIDRFVEVHVACPLEVCEQRDPKGIYAKARAGEIRSVPGFDAPYEAPVDPELRIDATAESSEDAAGRIVDHLRERGFIDDAHDRRDRQIG